VWYGLKSSSSYTTTINISWGGAGYAPVKGDYDGDGKTDLATYVTSTGVWYVLLSGGNYTTTLSKSWGGSAYTAVPQYP
jgi:FG-GAP repeat